MSAQAETILCPVQTRAARFWVDPEPAEYCSNEVADYGDLCDQHEAMDACEDYDA